MLGGLLVLLAFQLVGELVVRLTGLPVPGPVLGMVGLLVALSLYRPASEAVAPAADGLLRVLSLLFVPAGVGVVQYLALIRAQWLPIAAALLLGTAITLGVTAGVMRTALGWGRRAP